MAHDPLSPSEALRTRIGGVLAAVSAFLLAYSLVIVGQVILGVMIASSLTVGLYLAYRTLAVLDSIADAAQRFAAVREREADESGTASRFDRPVERERPRTETGRSAERTAEHDR
ncbi:hypothetical protein [Halorubrum sp. DTA46]|uniref:hypothetical protein n=1 Tax=Halorubrum sp. DTA46 TaxID=3402162 RepID=UPI003AB050CC